MSTYGQRINDLRSGQSIVLEKVSAGGSLEARRLGTDRVQFYWRHTADGKTERTPIGIYDPVGPPRSMKPTARGFSVHAALDAARELAKVHRDTPGGLRAERERQRIAREAEASAAAARQRYTLKSLCADYCAWLKAGGKTAWREAENIFNNHLIEAFPEVARKPAAEVEKREIINALRRLVEVGKTTTARKLRAYARAAYACALRADSDANLPSSFIGYHVTSNPVDATAAIRGKADKNPLPLYELRTYWHALRNIEGVIGPALRLHVVTGGQRVVQLTRLTAADVARGTVRIRDPKGSRTEAREHLLPITKAMGRELDRLPPTGFVFSTDGGKTPMHPTSISAWAQETATAAGIKGFQLKRVRSGVETALAEAGVTREIRGQLQSHGIGGVQQRHYDAHDYMAEKRMALEALHRLLESEPHKINEDL